MAAPGLMLSFAAHAWAMPPPPPDPLGDLRPSIEDLLSRPVTGARGPAGCGAAPGDNILVCGVRGRRYREEFPPTPGERRRLIAGEAPSALGALNAGAPVGMQGIDVIGVVRTLGRGLDRILHPD